MTWLLDRFFWIWILLLPYPRIQVIFLLFENTANQNSFVQSEGTIFKILQEAQTCYYFSQERKERISLSRQM